MKRLIFRVLVLGALSSGSAMAAETSTDNGVKFGLNFEQQAYLRQGVMVELPVDGGSFVGLNVGAQQVFETNAEGFRKVRPQADYGLYFGTGLQLTSLLKSRLGAELGYQTYRGATDKQTSGFGYVDVFQGFEVSYGKIGVSFDLALRNNLAKANKDIMIGDKKVYPTSVYPRFGLSYSL
jgi:hypothetical protein